MGSSFYGLEQRIVPHFPHHEFTELRIHQRLMLENEGRGNFMFPRQFHAGYKVPEHRLARHAVLRILISADAHIQPVHHDRATVGFLFPLRFDLLNPLGRNQDAIGKCEWCQEDESKQRGKSLPFGFFRSGCGGHGRNLLFQGGVGRGIGIGKGGVC